MEVDPRGFINEPMRNVRKVESRMTLSFLVWVPEKCRTQGLESQLTRIFVLASLLDQHDIFKFISHMNHLPSPVPLHKCLNSVLRFISAEDIVFYVVILTNNLYPQTFSLWLKGNKKER